jgi:catechol 2,3-dioxygenase-like lactoylglutathione lyase family enzyme
MITPHHIGICVSVVERSLRFWCDGLGFEQVAVMDVGSEWSDAMEIGGHVAFTVRFLTKDGYTFEILHFEEPHPHGSPSTRRDQIGFTHLTVDVDDLDATIAHLAACDGTVIPSTRTRYVSDGGQVIEVVFVTDPDGVRVELACHHGGRRVL